MKDIKFELNTQSSGKVEFITPSIKGEVVSVIISTETPIEVNIAFEDDNRIVLYNDVQFVGTKYLPLGIEPIYKDGDKLKYALSNWWLNNKLRVNVSGKKFTLIKFVIRYLEK